MFISQSIVPRSRFEFELKTFVGAHHSACLGLVTQARACRGLHVGLHCLALPSQVTENKMCLESSLGHLVAYASEFFLAKARERKSALHRRQGEARLSKQG